MAIDFPASPTNGQTFTAAGVQWTWDGVKWTASGLSLAYLPLAGGTMTGPIVLAANPAAPLQPATKQYVDALPVAMNDNRIINGDMRIDQRNSGASGTAIGVYTVDRWQYNASQAAKGTWGRNLNGWARPDFPYCLGFQSSSAYASLATDNFRFSQPIEADMVSDFQWGTASAQPVTLSFWAASTLTGTFGGAIRNGAGTRSYPFSFTLPTASTWGKIVITIPGDTAGTWVMSGNSVALYLEFDLGCGVNFRGPANAWAAANYLGATGAVSIVGTNSATFYVTGVKLEVGSVATPFNRQSPAKSLADCQRYFQAGSVLWFAGYASGSITCGQAMSFPVMMRAAPTVNFGTPSYTSCSGLASNNINIGSFAFSIVATASFIVSAPYNASAEL